MAAKGKGESRQGLIITLVCFVLLSIVLGVVAYFGYADRAQMQTERANAIGEKAKADSAREYYRWQAFLARAYMGHLPPKDAQELSDVMMDKYTAADPQGKRQVKQDVAGPDKQDMSSMIAALEKDLGWQESLKKPAVTYKSDYEKKKGEIANLQAQLKSESQLRAQTDAELKRRNDELESTRNDFKKQLDAQKQVKEEDLKKYLSQIKEQGDELKKLSTEKEDVQTALADQKDKYDKEIRVLKQHITRLEERVSKAENLKPPTNYLEFDQPKGKIVGIEGGGRMPYINLGRDDNLRPHVTFSIHGVGADGKTPIRESKGRLEVVEIVGPKLARAQITQLTDEMRDPVMRGDLLFNPVWSPNLKQHVAIAGIVDLTGDIRHEDVNQVMRSIQEFRRNLEEQGIVVDAYLDLKEGAVKGQITRGTDYLILGDQSEAGVGLVREDDPKEQRRSTTSALIAKMRDEAKQMGVTVIKLRDFLNLIGYRIPPAIRDKAPTLNFRPTNVPAPSPLERSYPKLPPDEKGPINGAKPINGNKDKPDK